MNVIGNLLTAAVIYLGAVVGGYLAASPVLLTVALGLIGGGLVVPIVNALESRHRRQNISGVGAFREIQGVLTVFGFTWLVVIVVVLWLVR